MPRALLVAGTGPLRARAFALGRATLAIVCMPALAMAARLLTPPPRPWRDLSINMAN